MIFPSFTSYSKALVHFLAMFSSRGMVQGWGRVVVVMLMGMRLIIFLNCYYDWELCRPHKFKEILQRFKAELILSQSERRNKFIVVLRYASMMVRVFCSLRISKCTECLHEGERNGGWWLLLSLSSFYDVVVVFQKVSALKIYDSKCLEVSRTQ